MKNLVRRLWQLSWLVTLPVAAVFVLWAMKTYDRYVEFHVRQDTPDRLGLLRSGQLEFDRMVAKVAAESRALGVADRLSSTGLRTISLFVGEGSLQQLNEHLPDSGHRYVDGGLASGKQPVQSVEVRYRGDSVYHWGYWKKSWRVKTKKGQLFQGMRKFNLIATRTPNLLNNHLAYRLATHMGLTSPYSEVVNVILNGELLGVYILTEQLDESTIRRHGLMPGDVYSGDNAGETRFKGHSNLIFDQSSAWTKVAVNNHFEEGALAPLEELLFHLRYVTRREGQAGLSQLMDMEQMGRSAAFDAFTQTSHSENTHNWRLYYDPWKTKFAPVIWDTMGWMGDRKRQASGKIRLDSVMSDMHAALARNGDFLRARQAAVEEFFRAGKDQIFLAEVRELVEQIQPAIEADPNLVFRGVHLSPEYVVDQTQYLPVFMSRIFAEVKKAHTEDQLGATKFAREPGQATRLSVAGRIPVSELAFVYDRPIRGPIHATVSYSAAGERHDVDVSGAATVSGATVTLHCGLVPRPQFSGMYAGRSARMSFGAAVYDIVVTTETEGATLLHVQERRASSGPMNHVDEVERISPQGFGDVHQVVVPRPVERRLVYAGDVVIRGNQIVEGDLLIEPGARLLFEPGANLLVLGQVDASGTEEQPIQFGPKTEGQEPWGVFAIKGAGADGSQFRHCCFREGSGWKQPLAEYSAMFCIHHVQGVNVEHCVFEDSRIVDDMVHGVYSEVKFHDCRFVRSLFDALDMDISTVEVLRCEFLQSGNDAVDLMTAKATVDYCQFIQSADKGISVGEDSLVLVHETLFDRCLIGVQTKDESTAVLIHCDLVGCETGVDGLKKNWRYDGGGEAFIYRSHMSDSGRSLHADSHSRLVVWDSFIDDLAMIRRKQIDLDESVDNVSRRDASSMDKLSRHPNDLRAMGTHGDQVHVRPTRKKRGSRLRASK